MQTVDINIVGWMGEDGDIFWSMDDGFGGKVIMVRDISFTEAIFGHMIQEQAIREHLKQAKAQHFNVKEGSK